MYLRCYALLKRRLDKYLKSAVFYYLLTSNMLNALKHCSTINGHTFTIVIDQWEDIEFEKGTPSDMENRKTVS